MEDKYIDIPQEKFEFANMGDRITDKKFDTKPIGYFKDAFIRFCKNKASVVAAIIIGIIILYALLVPLFASDKRETLLDVNYLKKGPRSALIKDITNNKLMNGGTKKELVQNSYIYEIAKGVDAENGIRGESVSLVDSLGSKYSPINKVYKSYTALRGTVEATYYSTNLDAYLGVGFVFLQIPQVEYKKIQEYEETTGLKILYPLIDEESDYYFSTDPTNAANYWYKAVTDRCKKSVQKNYGMLTPVLTGDDGKPIYVTDYDENLVLEDNYLRDDQGNVRYWRYIGGGNADTAEYKVRVLYYNYYIYKNGFEPNYLFGTDSQGYDLAVRMASGLRLSLMLSVVVSFINFIIGALYGAVEGYYGGIIDLTLERVSDILSGVPFIIVATLFQMHLAQKVGPVASLIFAFVLTGWIGTAYRVRSQFYRFKNQEYVMAARTLGASDNRIIWKHIFPNTLGTIITSSVLVIPGTIFSESMLSFLGIVNLGGSKTTSLGTLLSDASSIWTMYPHLMIFPATVISLLMICFNLFGNGLRDAFNPTLRGADE